MPLTGWHLGRKPSGWLDFWCNSFHPSSRGDEARGRDESEESGGEFKAWKASTVSSPPFRDSAGDTSSLSSHCVRETFGISFVVVQVDIGSSPPAWVYEVGKRGSGKNPWRGSLSTPEDLSARDAPSSHVQIKFYPKVQFGSDLWKNGEPIIHTVWDFKEQEVASHTSLMMRTCH